MPMHFSGKENLIGAEMDLEKTWPEGTADSCDEKGGEKMIRWQ